MKNRNSAYLAIVITTAFNVVAAAPAFAEAVAKATVGVSSGTQLLDGLKQRSASELCRIAAQRAESRFQLPRGMLWAIAQVESSRPAMQTDEAGPWPWTVQALGKGQYFNTKAEAVAWARNAQASGIASIDTGCLQVNLFYHPNAFRTLEEAFDPQRNADYAGRFLRELYGETRDWSRATGLYHSRTLTISMSYQEKVGHTWRDIGQSTHFRSRGTETLRDLAAAWGSTLDDNSGSSRISGRASLRPSSEPTFSEVVPLREHTRLINIK
jgi:hypothetical protein